CTVFLIKSTLSTISASLASTKRSASKISEVYSNSENTMEFAHNFSVYLTSIVSPSLISGSFNLPYCTLQPMIPIYLVVTGSLFIVAAIIRIYSLWPVPENTRQSSSLGITLLCRLIEALVLLAILVWLILGAVYVYSARRTYHRLGPDMFEKHYCDPGTYWIAFVSVSLHIALIALIILVAIVILACGLWKETGQQIRQNNNY
uniref:MARVEL domain-containing protein n=1 Tax=Syphacia muris TaxID=451379 RepID=A0A0N5AJZ4_9BILA